jgi:hypothetical protein
MIQLLLWRRVARHLGMTNDVEMGKGGVVAGLFWVWVSRASRDEIPGFEHYQLQ